MATTRITSGFGVAPGFGTTKKKPVSPGFGNQPNSIQTSLAAHPVYKAQMPSAGGVPATTFTPPPQPSGNPLPVDPLYDQTLAGLGKTRGDTLADLTRQRQAGLLGYGYNATYGQDGLVQGLAYDPNNPYSQAALARTVYQQSKNGTNNSMAARGQFGGALTNAQNTNDTNFNVGENSRQTALTNFLNGITGAETAAKNAYDTGKLTADGDRLGRAPTNPNYNPTPPAAAAPSTADLIKQWQADPVKTTYTNAQGHPVRVHANGTKEVFVNGVWKRV